MLDFDREFQSFYNLLFYTPPILNALTTLKKIRMKHAAYFRGFIIDLIY